MWPVAVAECPVDESAEPRETAKVLVSVTVVLKSDQNSAGLFGVPTASQDDSKLLVWLSVKSVSPKVVITWELASKPVKSASCVNGACAAN
jgi:hypothetical protein